MTSVVDICNRALSNKLGGSRITSLNDDSKGAKECSLAYEYVRDFVLRAHVWNCTVKRAVLSPLSSIPEYEHAYEYQLPSDCIRILSVDTDYDWQVEGRKILTDEGTVLNIRYQVRETDPAQYDSMLVEAITCRLAYDICESITQSTSKKTELERDFKRVLIEAKAMDAQEGSYSTFKEDDWVTVRY